MKIVNGIRQENQKRIDTNSLNKAINEDRITRPPRFAKNKICKIFYVTQIDIDAPTFVVFVNHKDRANFAFKKRLRNTIRNHF
jgi:GTP-binding protein